MTDTAPVTFHATHGVDLANLPLSEPVQVGDFTLVNVRFLYDRAATGDNEAKVYSHTTSDAGHITELDKLANKGYMGIKRADGTQIREVEVVREVAAPVEYDKWSLDALKDHLSKLNDGADDDKKIVVTDPRSKDSYVEAFTAHDAANAPTQS